MNELFQANENPTLKNEYTPPAEISSELMIEDAYKKVQAFENYVDEHRKLNLTQTQNENKNVLDPNSENFVIDLFNKLETPSVSTNLANPSIFGYDPNRQTADTRFINDWEESLTGTATSMWRTLRNAMTDMSKNTLLGDYMLKTDTFGLTKGISLQSEYNTYLEKVGKIQDDYNNGLIDEENYQSKVKLIQDQYSDVLSEREKLLNEVQSYDDEIASRKINKKYTLTQSALEGDLDAGFIDKFTYQLPNLIGSSIGLMLPQALVTFTTNLARTQVVAGLSAATGAGAVATPVIEVAGTVVSALAAVGTLLHFRKQESLAELGGSYLNQMEKFKSDYLAKNPQLNFDESKIPFTALAEMEKKAVRGAEEVFKGNMLLATSDILQALLLPGSSLLKMVKTSSNIGRTLKTLDNINDVAKPSLFNSITSKAAGLSKSFKDPVMYNKLFNSSVKPIATAGTALWVKGMLPEGFEEGYQYALGKRAEELAEMTEEQYNALGDNKIDLLGEAYDVATSLELNPTSFIAQTLGLGKIGSTTLGGKYVGDKEFEFSAHGGMLLAGMMGGISTGIKTTKDIAALTKYKKELVKIGAINEVGERVKSLHSNIGKALVNGRTEELKTAIRSLSSSYNNEEIKNYITKEEGEEYISKIEQLEEKYQRYSDRINSIPRDKFLSMGGSIDFKKGKQKVILDLMLAEDTIEESNKGLKELSIESRQVLRDEIQKVLPNEYSHLLDLLVDLKTNQLSEIALNTMDIAKGKFDAKGLNKTSRFFGKNFEEFSKSKKSSFSRIGEIRNQLKEMIADTVSVNENLAELNIDEILNIEDSSLFNNIIEEISLEANIYGNIQDFKKLSNIKSSKDILDYYTNLPEVKEEKIKEEKEKANKKEEEKSAEAAKVKAEKEEKKKKEEGKKEEKVEQEFDDITEEDESDIINSGLNENNARAERESSTFNSEEYLGELFENFPNKRIVDLNSLLDKKEELEALSGEEITAIIDSRNNLIEELINTYEPSSEAKKNSLIRAVNKIIDEFVEVRKNLHPEFSEEKDFEVENNVDLSDELDEEFEIEHYSQGEKETFNKTDKSHHVMTQAYKANKVTYTYNIPLFLVDSGAIQPNDDVKLFKGKWTNPETLETFEGYLFQMASGPLKGVDIAFMPEIERPKYTINNIETIAKIYKLIDEAKPGSFVYTKVSKIFDGPAFINKTDKGGAESVSIDKVYQLNMNDPSNNQVDKRIHFTSIKNEGRVGAVSLSFIPEELKGKKIVTAFNKLPAKGTPIALVPKMVNGEEKYMAIPLQRRNFSEFKEEFDKLLDNQSKLDSFYGKVVSKLSSLVKESKDSSGNTNFLKTYFKVNERKFTISDQDTAINVLTSIKNDPKIGINIYFIQTNTGINKIVKINSLIDAETGVVESKYILSKKFELEKEGKTINVKSVLIGSVLDHNGLHFTLVGDDVIHAPSSLNTTQENIIEGYEEAVGVKPTTLPEAFGIIDSLKTDVNVKHLSSLEKGMENKEDKTLLYNEARKNIIQFGLFKTYAVRTTGKVSKDGPVNTDQQYYNALIQSPAYKKLSDEQKEYGKFQYYGASYSTIGLPASISEYKVMSEAEFKASENKTPPTESKDESSKESDNAPKKTPSKKTAAKKTSTKKNVEQELADKKYAFNQLQSMLDDRVAILVKNGMPQNEAEELAYKEVFQEKVINNDNKDSKTISTTNIQEAIDNIEKERNSQLLKKDFIGELIKWDGKYRKVKSYSLSEEVVNFEDNTSLHLSDFLQVREFQINKKYDEDLLDLVKSIPQAKQQALDALKKTGRENSDVYKQIASLEQPQPITNTQEVIEGTIQTIDEQAEEIWRNDVNEKGFPNRALSEVKEELLKNNQFEIEQQKADIEIRREEVRELFKTNPILALHIIKKERKIGSYDQYGRPNGEVQNIVSVLKVSVSKAQELLQDYLNAGKPQGWKFGDNYDYSKYDAELDTLTSNTTQQKADIAIGKILNTNYEVKVDGVYFEGKKLDNPKNLSHKELITEDIRRRKEDELFTPWALQNNPTDADELSIREKGKEFIDLSIKSGNSNLIVKIIDLASKGRSAATISKETGFSENQVRAIREYLGVLTPGGFSIGGTISEDEQGDIERFNTWKQGINEINAKYNTELESLNNQTASNTSSENVEYKLNADGIAYEKLKSEIEILEQDGNKQPEEETISLIQELEKFEIEEDTIVTSETYNLNNSDYVRVTRAYEEDLNKVKEERGEDISSEKWKDLSMTLNVANQGAIGDANDIINRTLMSKLLTFNSKGEVSLTPLINAVPIINEITIAVQDKLGKEVRDKLFPGNKLKTLIESNVSYLGKQIEALNKVVTSKEFIDKYGKLNGSTTKEILLRNAGPTGRKIAGTSDILFTTDGGYIMPSDFKITSNIDPETVEKFTYQLSYYGVLLKTMGFDKITDEAFIFHTPYISETRDDDDLITRVFGEEKDEITQDDYQKVAEAYRRGEYLDLIKPVIGLNAKDKDLIIRLNLKVNDNDFINMVLQPEVSSKVETFNSSSTPVETKLKESPKEEDLNLEGEKPSKTGRKRITVKKEENPSSEDLNNIGNLIAFQNNKSSEEIRNDKDEVMVLTNTEKFDLTQGFLNNAANIIFKNSETGDLTYLSEIRESGINSLGILYNKYADALDELEAIEKPTKEELNRITRLKNLFDKIDFILTEQTNPKTGETYYPNVDPLMREVKRHLKAYSIKIEDDTFSYEDTERNDPSFDDTTIEEDFISKIHQDVKIIMSLTPDYHLDRGEWKRKSNRFGLYTKANFNNVYLAIKSAMTKRYDSSEAGMNELIDDLHNSNNPIVSSFAEMLKNIGDPVKNNQIKKAFFKSFATYNQSAVLSVDEYTTDKEGNTTFKATQRNAKNLSRITSAETFLVQMIEQEAFIGEEGDKKSRTITKKSGEEIPLFYEDYNFETNSNEVHYGVFALTELSDKIKDIIGSISERSKSFLGKSTEEANNNSGRKSLYLEIYRNNLLENGLEEHKISKDLLEEYENDEEAVTIALEKLIEEELAFNNQAQLEAYNVFKDLGFNVTPQSFLNYLEKGGLSSKQGVAPQVKFGALLENNLSSLISALINEANGRTTPVSSLATATKSRLRTIASAVVDELSMTAVGNAMVGDKTRSPHVRYSFINGIFATMEQALEEGNIELIKSLYKGKFASNPAFIDHFTSAIAGDKSDMPVMSYNFGNTVKGTNEYVDIKDFTEIDFLRNMFLKHQNAQGKPSYFSDTLSDKSVMLVYSTMRNKLNPFKGSLNGDNLTMSQSDLALFQRYVVSEYESIIEAEKESGLRTTTEGLTKNNKISGYHTHKNSEDSITLGLGHKFVLFPYLNPEILAVNPLNIKGADRLLSKMYNKNKDGSYSIKPKDKFNIEDGEVKSLISNIINKSVVQSAKDLKKRLIDFKVLVEEVDVVNNVEVRNYDKLSSILFSEGYVGHSSNDGDTKHTVLTYDVIKELMYEEFDGAEESVRNDLHNQIFNFIKTKNINSFKNLEVREKIIDFAILDFTLGYEIKSIELLKLTGHPAMMAKEVTLGTKVENGQSQYERFLSDDNYKAKVLTEMIAGMANNLSKRNASLMAAGNLGAWKNREYRLAIADDIKVNSKHLRQYIDELKSRGFLTEKDITDSYEGADIADAQEFVTVFEHLSFMESFSYINEDEFKGALFIHDIEEYYKHYTKEPTQDQIKLGEKVVFSAEKPVQRIKLDQEDVNNPRELYVKSSSYTLFPLMVKGTPFEDVLKGMKKNRVDRLVFKSGVKHGLGLKGTNQLFIGDGTAEDNFMLNPDFFVDSNNPSDEHNILTLDRNNFFLQLEVPYESDKSTVTTSSQQKRMTFLNLANNLEVLFDLEGGKPKVETIGKLKNRFFDSYKRIHEAEMSKLKKELDIDDKGQIRNLQLFSKIITEEAKSSAKNFSPNTIEGLKVIKGRDGKFEYQIPLGFSLNTKDIEPVITSLIEKRIAKYKMPGFSKVQGSEIWATGDTKRKGKFKSDETLGELRLNEENLYNQIVWTSKEYVGKTKLNHTHKNDRGQVEMTEALTSQYLNDGNNKIDLLTKDENGEFLFLDNEAFKEDGSYVIDKTKIDPSILEINGFRIPYQGFNSGAAIKIVGFLPKAMGDLIIVPGEIAGQMGSDYDVDKIYAYNYNYYYTFKNGKPYVKRVNSSTTLADLNRSKNILAAAIREEMERVIIFSEETDKDEYFYSLFPELNEDNKNLSDEAIASEVDSLDYIASNNRRRILGNLGIKAKAIKTFTADDLTIKKAQNEIIAIHMSIYTTPEIFGDVINPNSMAIIKETNEYFDELVGANNNDINYAGLVLTGVQSPAHQFDLYFSNKSGKTGVAIASLAATGHSMAQLSNLYFEDTALYVRDASGHIINEKFDVEDNLLMDNKSAESIYSGRIVEEEVDGKTVRRMSGGLWRADKVYTIKDLKRSVFDADGKVSYVKLNRYLISDVITHIQSMAVDNAKEQLLALYGLNDQNFSLGMAIVRMGIHPYLAKVFLKQPAVLETYSRLARLDSIYENSFTPDKFKTIVSEVKDEIIEKLETIRPFNKEELEKLEKNPLEFHKLEKALYDGFNLTMAPSEEFLISQYATLVNLEKFNNMSDIFGTLSKITNIDSKGLGGSVQAVVRKNEDLQEALGLKENSKQIIGNVEKLINKTASGILAQIPKTVLDLLSSRKNPLFFHNAPVVEEILTAIKTYVGRENLTDQQRNDIIEGIRNSAYVTFAKEHLLKVNQTISGERLRLLTHLNAGNRITGQKNLPLYERIVKARGKISNYLLNSIHSPNMNDNNKVFKHLAIISSQDPLHKDNVIRAWEDLLNDSDESMREIAKDLILYSMIVSPRSFGAFNMLEYVPNNYLNKLGFSKFLRTLNREMFNISWNSSSSMYNIVKNLPDQIIQHNIGMVKTVREVVEGSELYDNVSYVDQNGRVKTKSNVLVEFELINPSSNDAKYNRQAKNLIYQFKYKDNLGSDKVVDLYPTYLSKYDPKTKEKNLYKADSISENTGNVIYKIVDKAGLTQFVEYDLSSNYVNSFVNGNKATGNDLGSNSQEVINFILSSSLNYYRSNKDSKLADLDTELADMDILINQIRNNSDGLGQDGPGLPLGETLNYIERYLFEQIGIVSNTQSKGVSKDSKLADLKRLHALIRAINTETPEMFNGIVIKDLQTRINSVSGNFDGSTIRLNISQFNKDDNPFEMSKDLALIRVLLHEVGEIIPMKTKDEEFLKTLNPERVKQINEANARLDEIYDEYVNHVRNNLDPFETMSAELLRAMETSLKFSKIPSAARDIQTLSDLSNQLSSYHEFSDGGKKLLDKIVDAYFDNNVHILKSDENVETVRRFLVESVLPDIQYVQDEYYAYANKDEFIPELMSNDSLREQLFLIPSKYNGLQRAFQALVDLFMGLFGGKSEYNDTLLEDALDSLFTITGAVQFGDGQLDEMYKTVIREDPNLDITLIKERRNNILLSQTEIAEEEIIDPVKSYKFELDTNDDFLSNRVINTEFILEEYQKNTITNVIDKIVNDFDKPMVINAKANSGKTTMLTLIDKYFKSSDDVSTVLASTSLVGSAKLQLESRKYNNKGVVNLKNYFNKNGQLEELRLIRSLMDHNEGSKIVLLIDNGEDLTPNEIEQLQKLQTENWSEYEETKNVDLNIVIAADPDGYTPIFIGQKGVKGYVQNTNNNLKNAPAVYGFENVTNYTETKSLTFGELISPIKKLRANEDVDFDTIITEFNTDAVGDEKSNMESVEQVISEEEMSKMKNSPKQIDQLFRKFNVPYSIMTRTLSEANRINDMMADFYRIEENYAPYQTSSEIIFTKDISDKRNRNKSILPGIVYKVDKVTYETISFQDSKGNVHEGYTFKANMKSDVINDIGIKNSNFSKINNVNVVLFPTEDAHYDYIGEFNISSEIKRFKSKGVLLNEFGVRSLKNKQFLEKLDAEIEKLTKDKETEGSSRVYQLKTLRNSLVSPVIGKDRTDYNAYTFYAGDRKTIKTNQKSNIIGLYDKNESEKNGVNILEGEGNIRSNYKQFALDLLNAEPLKIFMIKQALEFSQESNLPTGDETINIYAGSNQNTELSNFAIRPFTTNVETSSGEKQYTFQSVEQGFHFYKALVANNPQVAKQILATTNGGQLKRLTNRSNLKMTPEQVKEWDDTSKSIMLNLMYDSYVQNPEAVEKLLATGNAKITHTQDNTRWKTDFPEVVMTVRGMLKEEGFGKESNFPEKNIFTVEPIQSADKKSKSKAKIATQFIGFAEGIAGSSTALYAKQISEQSKNSVIEFQEEQSFGYIERTRKNASADATIDFGLNQKGESWTKKAVDNNKKKYIGINTNNLTITSEMVAEIVESLNSVNAKTLNIAGMGIYNMRNNTQEQVDEFVYNLLKQVIESPNLNTKIESIRTGGQTGFDEAGAKAAQKLGIKTIVLAPKGWIFRDKEGKDISNRQEFESRFNQSSIVNSGNYSSNDVIFVSIVGKRGNEAVRKQQQNRTIREVIKALEAGATLITDNAAYVESSSYNEGEKRLAANLKAKGYSYSETTVDGHLLGVWNKNTNQITSQQKQQGEKVVEIKEEKPKETPEKKAIVKPKPDLNEEVGFTRKHLGYSADLIEYILEDVDLHDLSYSDTPTDQEKQDFTNKVEPRIVKAIKEKIIDKKEFNVEDEFEDETLSEQLGFIVSSKDFITMVRNILAYVVNKGGIKFTGNLEGRYLDVSKDANKLLNLESSIETILKSFLGKNLEEIKNKINKKAVSGEHLNYFSEIKKQLKNICG